MTDSASGTSMLFEEVALEEFTLDVRVVEAAQPLSGLLLSTSDNCGSSCEGTACTSTMGYPA